MIAQMQTLTFAGHETTASTLSWMLYELSKHPDYQAKMRAEIKATRQTVRARGDDRFSMEDLDSMTTVMNAIKVCSSCRCPQCSYRFTDCTFRKRCASIPSFTTFGAMRGKTTSSRFQTLSVASTGRSSVRSRSLPASPSSSPSAATIGEHSFHFAS